MGDGPDYLFFRPYHLLHFEAAWTIAEVVLDRRPIAAPSASPVAEVLAVAKKPLEAGEVLDGIGGYACYGHIDTVEGGAGMLPIGLAEHARVTRPVARDEAVPLDAVELDDDALLVRLHRDQQRLLAGDRAR
jgi:predicted homoserine dehydrogenase-like protein